MRDGTCDRRDRHSCPSCFIVCMETSRQSNYSRAQYVRKQSRGQGKTRGMLFAFICFPFAEFRSLDVFGCWLKKFVCRCFYVCFVRLLRFRVVKRYENNPFSLRFISIVRRVGKQSFRYFYCTRVLVPMLVLVLRTSTIIPSHRKETISPTTATTSFMPEGTVKL